MTPQQIEFIGQVVTIVGGIVAAALALLQAIKTALEIGNLRRQRSRRQSPRRRRAGRGRPGGRGSARRGRAPPFLIASIVTRRAGRGGRPSTYLWRIFDVSLPPAQNLRPRMRYCLDGLQLANAEDCRPLIRRGGNLLS